MKFYVGYPCKSGTPISRFFLFIKLPGIICCAVLLLANTSSRAQDITIRARQAPIRQVLQQIRAQSGYDFLMETVTEKKARPVTVDFTKLNIREAMNKCLENQPLNYTIIDHTVLITEKEQPREKAGSRAKNRPDTTLIVGQISNKDHLPLSGATVLFKKSGKGVSTDVKGRYIIQSFDLRDSLIFRYMGYNTEVRSVRTGTSFVTMDIVMEETKNDLDQVVIRGYTTTTKRTSTGDIATVTGEDLAKQPVANPLLALQGKVPGVVITQLNGSASGPIKIEIRGRKGVNPNFTGEPLYIIDGVPLTVLDLSADKSGNRLDKNGYAFSSGFDQSGLSPNQGQSPFFGLDAHNIESVTILKDADATAIYGSRGANGVILITTKKKGSREKPGWILVLTMV